MTYANSDSADEHFKSFVADTALQDVVHHHAPGLIDHKIYIHGRKRLDYILVSEDVLTSSVGG